MSTISTKSQGKCEKIIVTTSDGRKFDLGSPDSRLFAFRRKMYLFKRRNELKEK